MERRGEAHRSIKMVLTVTKEFHQAVLSQGNNRQQKSAERKTVIATKKKNKKNLLSWVKMCETVS